MLKLKHALSSTRPSTSGPSDHLGGWAVQGLSKEIVMNPSMLHVPAVDTYARLAISGRYRQEILRNILGSVVAHAPKPVVIVHCDSALEVPTFTDAPQPDSDNSWLNDPSDNDEFFKDGKPWPPGYVPQFPRVKQYILKPKPLLSAFSVRALLSTVLRCTLLCYIPVLEAYLSVEDEEELQGPGSVIQKPMPDLVQPAWTSLRTGLREVTVVTTRRILERLAIAHASRRTAFKMLKDYADSAVRKYSRGLRGIPLATRVFRTTCHSHVLAVVAVFLVQCCVDTWQVSVRVYNVDWKASDRKEVLRILKREGGSLVRNTAGNAFRGSVSLVGACAGSSAGSVLWVGTGTWIGGFLGEMIAASIARSLWLEIWRLYG